MGIDEMHIWLSKFETARPLRSMPRLLCVAQERRFYPEYRCAGRFRRSDDHCLFKYTLSGEGAFRDAAGERRAPVGHGFLCVVNDPATEYYHPGPADVPWEFVYVCFDGAGAIAMTRELVERHGPVFKLEQENPALLRLLNCRQDEAVVELGPGKGAGLVFELLAALDASKDVPDEVGGNAALELVRKARRLMAGSMPRGMSIGELADALAVSREHLSRVFAKQTGVAPHVHMLRLRMAHACRLLKESGMAVKEVGDVLGVETPQHFTRLFKKAMKMTPTQFRRHGVVPMF